MSITGAQMAFSQRTRSLLKIQTLTQAINHGIDKRGLNSLIRNRLIRVESVLAYEPNVLIKPLAVWSPGDPEPPLRQLAADLDRRRAGQVLRELKIVVAARRAADMFGDGSIVRTLCPFDISHAVGVSAMILGRAALHPDDLVIDEATIRAGLENRKRGGRKLVGYVPDAAVIRPGGEITLALDYGGYYGLRRLESLHHSCSMATIGWEVW